MNNFVGMFIYISEDEYYHYGEIKKQIDDYILVALQTTDFKNALRMYHIDCLAHAETVFLFETKKNLDDWLVWIEASDNDEPKLKVVNFKKEK